MHNSEESSFFDKILRDLKNLKTPAFHNNIAQQYLKIATNSKQFYPFPLYSLHHEYCKL